MLSPNFGRFLSNMVMPNIGAFIAWGFITALFIPTGWLPNETLAKLVGPMITYLLPLLIGYTGGKLMGGDRGGVVGAITTMGVIVGTDIPMFMGAMMVGPLGGWAIKRFDKAMDGRVKSGFEMLVNNFSAGLIGMLLAILAFFVIGPFVKVLSGVLAGGVGFLVDNHMLPLTSIFVEPAKILFLNNAINHGIFSPLMNPRLILAVIAGGMTGVFTLTLFNAGLVSPASPGSIFAVLLMTPKASLIGVLLSITAATLVSFLVAAVFVRAQQPEADEADALGEATRKMKAMKGGKPETAAAKKPGGELMAVRNIVVACDAGMGSSAMGAGMLRKRVQAAGLDISVTNRAIDQLDDQVDWVITHKDLTERARRHAPHAHHISLTNFLDNGLYQELVQSLTQAANDDVANPQLLVAANDDSYEPQAAEVFTLSRHDVHLGLKADNKEAAILTAGRLLAERGYVAPDYVNAMLEREQLVSTYLGESIAVPHGTARNDEHMQVITRLTNALDEPGLIDRLASTTDPQAFLDLLGAEQAA